MSLLIDPKVTFDVVLTYKADDKSIVFVEADKDGKLPDGTIKETFKFRKPNWRDTRIIVSASMQNGNTESLDALAYTEAKVKTLLVEWSLTDNDGKPLPIHKFDQLSPTVILKLSSLIDEKLGESGLTGMK